MAVALAGRYGGRKKRSIQDILDKQEWDGRMIRENRKRFRESFVWKNIIRADENDLKKRRRWEEMDHEILVNIMRRLSWVDWYHTVLKICKSWLLAAVDVFFPSPNALDLRPHDDRFAEHPIHNNMLAEPFHAHTVMVYMKLVLDSHCIITRRYTQLFYPKTPLPSPLHSYLARRLPLLQRFELPVAVGGNFCQHVADTVPHWKNLEGVHFPVEIVEHLGTHCKKIHTLHLFGSITDAKASIIAENFPLLKHLEIPDCVLSIDALSTMLDGHKSLVTLNTKHCHCLDDKDLQPVWEWASSYYVYRQRIVRTWTRPNGKTKEWKEEEILRKAAGIKRHLQCARKNCSRCSHLY